ncbi:MAG: hypothetical protein RL020_1340 [Pseudomonadota bacterium]|jgi:uncharacterized membrane protein YecN with MAPEG domain
MLFSTDYPSYQDPIGDEHDTRPHLLLHAVQKMAEYIGDFFAALFVMAFTGMEIVFVLALGVLLVQGLLSWEGLQDAIRSASLSWQAWVE